jgi:Na+-translocating ferredoxin:NAD+ oxidoreductase subunit A
MKMKELIIIFIGSALISNVVLNQFLGLCSFIGVSGKIKTAFGMGAAVIFVTTAVSALSSAIYFKILVPSQLEYLQTIVFVIIIAALVQLVEMVIKKFAPALYNSLGVYLALITTNCAVLGVALINVQKEYNQLESIASGIGTGAGFVLAIVLMAGIREDMEYNDIPTPFRGMPIVLITAGLMAIAFFGFSGLL